MFGNEFKGVGTPVFIVLPVLIFGMIFQVLIVPVVDILPVLIFGIVVGANGNGAGIMVDIQIVQIIANINQNIAKGDILSHLYFLNQSKIHHIKIKIHKYRNTIISPIDMIHSLMNMIQKNKKKKNRRKIYVNSILFLVLISIMIGNSIIIHQNQSDQERLVIIPSTISVIVSFIGKFIYYELEV